MTAWPQDELTRIGGAEALKIASLRPDGTPRDPVTIGVVPYGDGSGKHDRPHRQP